MQFYKEEDIFVTFPMTGDDNSPEMNFLKEYRWKINMTFTYVMIMEDTLQMWDSFLHPLKPTQPVKPKMCANCYTLITGDSVLQGDPDIKEPENMDFSFLLDQ